MPRFRMYAANTVAPTVCIASIKSASSFASAADAIADYLSRNRDRVVLGWEKIGDPGVPGYISSTQDAMTRFLSRPPEITYLISEAAVNAGTMPAQPVQPAGPRKPMPQCPPEVWNTRPIVPDDCMAAVRAMCKG